MSGTALQRFAALVALPDDRLDLLEAALLLAEADPPPDAAACRRELDALAQSAAARLRQDGSVRARVAALGQALFDDAGFRGNQEDYYDERNSFLHEVLRRRTGIPITLALVLIEVGRRLGLALEGVNFPGHFLLRHRSAEGDVLLDPFSGQVLSEADCAELLRNLAGPQAELTPGLLRAAPSRAILRRMLTNLKGIYLQRHAWPQALDCVERLLLLVPDEPDELRDRGLLHHRLERHDRAVADLERYLLLAADDPAAESVLPVLEAARVLARRLN